MASDYQQYRTHDDQYGTVNSESEMGGPDESRPQSVNTIGKGIDTGDQGE